MAVHIIEHNRIIAYCVEQVKHFVRNREQFFGVKIMTPKKTPNDPEISSVFYENFRLLCAQHGESITSLCRKIGIAKSSTTRWKKIGASPDTATIKKIADYFGVSINDLIGFQNVGNSTMLLTEEEVFAVGND